MEEVGKDESWEQQDRSRVVAHELRDTDEALERTIKAGEGAPRRSRRLDSCEIGESKHSAGSTS